MRIIKFREWNGIEMNYEPFISMISTASINERFLDNDFMQFTGLCDVKGKDIYEGDIVMIYGNKAQVIFQNGSFKIVTKNTNGEFLSWRYFKEEIKIIGNIYENPELLIKNK